MFDCPEASQTSPTRTSFKRDRVLARDRQLERTAGFERIESEQPVPVLVGGRGFLLAFDLDSDLLTGCGLAEDGSRDTGLQNHVVGKDPWHPHVGGNRSIE